MNANSHRPETKTASKRCPSVLLEGTVRTRELIDTGIDERFVRRSAEGQLRESDACSAG